MDPATILDDHARLQEIVDLDLLSDDVDLILNELAAEAAAHFDLPLGFVSVVLDETQHLAAQHGLDNYIGASRGTPVEWSYCQYSVRQRDAFVVEDSSEHELVKESPITKYDGLRCYAGIPLITSKGHAIGSFCVAGAEHRSFDDEEIEELRGYAGRAMERIEARRSV